MGLKLTLRGTMHAVNFGWPTSSLLDEMPQTEDEQSALIDALQDWKSLAYQDLIGGRQHRAGPAAPDSHPGLRL